MTMILAVDPGKTSGVAVLRWDGIKGSDPEIVMSAELSPEEYGPEINVLISAGQTYGDRFFVACESFVINAQTARNSQAPYSLEQIGILKYLCQINAYNPADIAFQAPVNAKNMFPNEKLKLIGTWHRGGAGHANDAIRHGLLRLVKLGWVPKILLQN